MAASSKHHVRNRILGGLGAVILVVVGLFMWQKTKVQLYDDPNTTGNTAGNLLNGGKFCEAEVKKKFKQVTKWWSKTVR